MMQASEDCEGSLLGAGQGSGSDQITTTEQAQTESSTCLEHEGANADEESDSIDTSYLFPQFTGPDDMESLENLQRFRDSVYAYNAKMDLENDIRKSRAHRRALRKGDVPEEGRYDGVDGEEDPNSSGSEQTDYQKLTVGWRTVSAEARTLMESSVALLDGDNERVPLPAHALRAIPPVGAYVRRRTDFGSISAVAERGDCEETLNQEQGLLRVEMNEAQDLAEYQVPPRGATTSC